MRVGRTWGPIGLVVSLAGALLGCTPHPSNVEPGAEASAGQTATFVSVIDGDTVETSVGTIRIIGIDTPERGECGYDEASAALAGVVAPGDPVTLELPSGQNDRDAHGRLLRFATTGGGTDLGLLQLQAGNAVARYDSVEGYPEHPREADYHAAQLATLSPDGSVTTVACQAAAAAPVGEPAPPAAAAPAPPATTDRWWEQYTSCTTLKKNTAGHPTGPFDRDDPAQAEAYDWFAHRTGNNGDGEGDGLACE